MRGINLLFALLALALCRAANLRTARDIKIIANPNVEASEISRDELNRIFLMTKTYLPGTDHVEPVLEKSGTTHKLFLKEYIGRSDEALMTYYRSLVFTGKALIPKSFDSDPEVADYVAKTKGAIGYVGITTTTAGVKILKVK